MSKGKKVEEKVVQKEGPKQIQIDPGNISFLTVTLLGDIRQVLSEIKALLEKK